jgi:hypothetical protein
VFDYPVKGKDYKIISDCKYGIGNYCADREKPERRKRIHSGIDFSAKKENPNPPVFACANGIVAKIIKNGVHDLGFGNSIIIKHMLANGKIVFSQYSHLDSIEPLGEENEVARGGKIGSIGATGYGKREYWNYTTGSYFFNNHLHFEIKDGDVLTNPNGPNKYFGYVPSNPDEFGYHNPENYIKAGSPITGNYKDTAGNKEKQSASPVQLPYEDHGACPFECCTYREWIAKKGTAILQEMKENSQIAFQVEDNEKVIGLTGVVITTKAGNGKISKSAKGDNVGIDSGSVVYILSYSGEGFWKVWHQGKIISLEEGTDFEMADKPETIWWVKIKNSKGQIGWTDKPDNFGNKDSCG